MGINPTQVETLAKAITQRFGVDDLNIIMMTVTGDALYDHWVAPGKPLFATAVDLLVALDKAGAETAVLAEMVRRRPLSAGFHRLVEDILPMAMQPADKGKVSLSVQAGGIEQPLRTEDAFAPGFQRLVSQGLPFMDVGQWGSELAAASRRVCRIEVAGLACGTGFLVGPSAVLTNWHVVEAAVQQGVYAETICRFDYQRAPDATLAQGLAIPVLGQAPACHLPYAPAEVTPTPDVPPPTADELDFALLELQQPIGDQGVMAGRRGWIALPEKAPVLKERDAILILQHPGAAPLKLAIDTEAVLAAAPGPRVRYRTNTLGGSSGAPVFTIAWKLAALHHFGDPGHPPATYNQGIPVDLVRAAIVQRGKGGMLGGAI